MMRRMFLVEYPEAKQVTKEEAEKLLGDVVPEAVDGKYFAIGTTVSMITSTVWPGTEKFFKKTENGIVYCWRGMEENCFRVPWRKW